MSDGITPIVRFEATFDGTIEGLRNSTQSWPGDVQIQEVESLSEDYSLSSRTPVRRVFSITGEQVVAQ